MAWQEKVYEYVCELCHDNGKRVSLLPLVENEKSHETSIPTDLEVGVTMNTNQRNGKVCILHYFLQFCVCIGITSFPCFHI